MKNAIPSRNQQPMQRKLLLLSAIALILLLTASCVVPSSPALTELSLPAEPSKKYRPLKLASGVQDLPGGIAWSPDGKTLAFIDGAVVLYDVASAKRKKVSVEGPHFLSWSIDNKLLVLSRDPEMDVLFSVDRNSLELSKTVVEPGAEAVFPTTDPRLLLVLSNKISTFSFGMGVALRITALGGKGKTDKVLYAMDRTYPGGQIDLRYLMAWTHAGPNPVDNSLLIIEHSPPPSVTPDSRVFGIDPLTGLDVDISDKSSDRVYISAGWSPDGRMVALTNGNGYLIIHTILGQEIALEPSIRGTYPSWSPWGHRIYAGGYLYDLSKNETEILLTNGLWSIGEWSPDGTALAVAANGDCWLFSDVIPAAVPQRRTPGHSLKAQMSRLQELFREGVITTQEYERQHSAIMLSNEDQ